MTASGKRHAPTQCQLALARRSNRNGIERTSIGCAESSLRFTCRREKMRWIAYPQRLSAGTARCTDVTLAAGLQREPTRDVQACALDGD